MIDLNETLKEAIRRARKDGRPRCVFATAGGYRIGFEKPTGNHTFFIMGDSEFCYVDYDFQEHKHVRGKARPYLDSAHVKAQPMLF